MKGIVHFISGVAAASFFPEAVRLAREEQSLILAFAGVFGILPDTLDFKFAQFLEKYTEVIDPDPKNIDPQEIAERTAAVIKKAWETGEKTSIMFQTIKLDADLWRQYTIEFRKKEVIVRIGPIVNTSKRPFAGTEPEEKAVGRAEIPCEVIQNYDEVTYVDIMNGPSFEFVPRAKGVEAIFIAWHRRWSHSLVLGCLIGLVVGALFGWIYGVVAAVAFNTHILEDQLGFMGSNLFWPLSKERTPGLHLMRSMDAWPNFGTFWLAVAIILFNLNRFSPSPVFTTDWVVFFSYAFFFPFSLLYLTSQILTSPALTKTQIHKEEEEERKEELLEGQGVA